MVVICGELQMIRENSVNKFENPIISLRVGRFSEVKGQSN